MGYKKNLQDCGIYAYCVRVYPRNTLMYIRPWCYDIVCDIINWTVFIFRRVYTYIGTHACAFAGNK